MRIFLGLHPWGTPAPSIQETRIGRRGPTSPPTLNQHLHASSTSRSAAPPLLHGQ